MSKAGGDYRSGRKQVIGGACNNVVAAGVTGYYSITGGALQALIGRAPWRMPFPAVFRNLRANINQAVGAGETATFTLMVENLASALTCQIAGAAALEGDDLVNNVAVALDDLIQMRIVTSGAAANVYVASSLEVVPI